MANVESELADAERALRAYYDRRAPEFDAIYHRDDRVEQRELAAIAEEIRTSFRDRRVLEIAAGTGYWTAIATSVAHRVLATDASARMLEIARRRDYQPASVEFRQLDAYSLEAFPETFDAGLANFWLSHVPRAKIADFLREFHARLSRGSVVLMADNVRVRDKGGLLVSARNVPDTFKLRRLADGSTHRIVKNYYGVAELRGIFSAYASNLTIRCGRRYWWLTYAVG